MTTLRDSDKFLENEFNMLIFSLVPILQNMGVNIQEILIIKVVLNSLEKCVRLQLEAFR